MELAVLRDDCGGGGSGSGGGGGGSGGGSGSGLATTAPRVLDDGYGSSNSSPHSSGPRQSRASCGHNTTACVLTRKRDLQVQLEDAEKGPVVVGVALCPSSAGDGGGGGGGGGGAAAGAVAATDAALVVVR
ncbi:uncharacterized protein LOC126092719 [Schistocerca cancellata]|uniref:uncharacterized protein LOC126092719 n=1 Tax=Schistocerca cancellata TaxID=274614 RepID=UPI002117C7C4|nr:uncharacterized protein LOC126092719 [Schistocerca cancellata]